MGEEDHLRNAVLAEGGLEFWALAIKPGKPFVCGWIRRQDGSTALYMGLPGNPVASYVTFLMLVRPVMDVLGGLGWVLPRPISLKAKFEWPAQQAPRVRARAPRCRHGGAAASTSGLWRTQFGCLV